MAEPQGTCCIPVCFIKGGPVRFGEPGLKSEKRWLLSDNRWVNKSQLQEIFKEDWSTLKIKIEQQVVQLAKIYVH